MDKFVNKWQSESDVANSSQKPQENEKELTPIDARALERVLVNSNARPRSTEQEDEEHVDISNLPPDPADRKPISQYKTAKAGDSPFASCFSGLFTIVVEARTSVEVALRDLGRLAFHRPFGSPEVAAWDEMLQCIALSSPDVDSSTDRMSWCLEPSGYFSTRSLYQAIVPASTLAALTSVWTLGFL
ncbi:ABC transporter G family member 37 [Hordeum vulgare]|nr:ABC transporter G family member 37 [Hordeum vulgare]